MWIELTGVSIRGLKGFSARKTNACMPLAPLTLVFGPNNGGKSTLLKATANLAQTLMQNRVTSAHQDWVESGAWFDLGGGQDCLHQGRGLKGGFELGFEFRRHQFGNEKALPSRHRICYQIRNSEVQSVSIQAENLDDSKGLVTAVSWNRASQDEASRVLELGGRRRRRFLRPAIDETESVRLYMPVRSGCHPSLITAWDDWLTFSRETVQNAYRRLQTARVIRRRRAWNDKYNDYGGVSSGRYSEFFQWVSSVVHRLREINWVVSEGHDTALFEALRVHPSAGPGRRFFSDEFILGRAIRSSSGTGPSSLPEQLRKELRLLGEGLAPDLVEVLDSWAVRGPDRWGSLKVALRHEGTLDMHSLEMDLPFRLSPPHGLLDWQQKDRRPGALKFKTLLAPPSLREDRPSYRKLFDFSQIMQRLTRGVVQWAGGVEYLGATRLLPRREYSTRETGARGLVVPGQRALNRLKSNANLLDEVNSRLKAIVGVELGFAPLMRRANVVDGTSELQETDLYQVRVTEVGDHHEMLGHQGGVGLPDVGYGLAQLIPLLTSILKQGTLFVEEPESNLHPVAQAKVIEVLVDAVQKAKAPQRQRRFGPVVKGPVIIMETHSEHILMRLLQLMEEGRVSDEDVSILYIYKDAGRTNWRRIRTDKGRLVDPINTDFSGNPTLSTI